MNVEKQENLSKNFYYIIFFIYIFWFRGKFYEDKQRSRSDSKERLERRSRSRSPSKGSLYNKSRSQSKSPNKEEEKKSDDVKADNKIAEEERKIEDIQEQENNQ